MTNEDLRHIPPDPPKGDITIGEGLVIGASLIATGWRGVLYGVGGIGKSSLACMAPGPVFYIDLDDTLSDLEGRFAKNGITMPQRIKGVVDWDSLLAAVRAPGWSNVSNGTLVIDSWSVLERMAVAWVIENVPHEKGVSYKTIKCIEDYGYSKGGSHVHDACLDLLMALREHSEAGRNVLIVAHSCMSTFPNPAGVEFVRYEPRIQTVSPTSKATWDTRAQVIEWSSHVFFVNYDVEASRTDGEKHGKGKGSGSRTIYPVETPMALAKSRTLSDEIVYREGDAELWRQLLA